jgi:hypothetical protein
MASRIFLLNPVHKSGLWGCFSGPGEKTGTLGKASIFNCFELVSNQISMKLLPNIQKLNLDFVCYILSIKVASGNVFWAQAKKLVF